MAYDQDLAERVRTHLAGVPGIETEEKKMFGGLAFMVNGKMCINVSGNRLMCRFDPEQTAQLSKKRGYLPMIMKGKEYKGYCYVEPIGFKSKGNFERWINLCLDFNRLAKSP
ncbi:TfoX/Sxy family protein [Chitinophaga arvensicola]|uniref:TfoX N-terminal domain-containing protein n=1 Tax=Chitinophaga arvensicola TaxID=29529 RepID=A0A1I0S753_9BACT|nr:TfoX/Sxy family protein [Chitinophaga arvensicola]SEW51560.1 TfoX N-terminal domain-containing protein [Chitinophaga arvensicola]